KTSCNARPDHTCQTGKALCVHMFSALPPRASRHAVGMSIWWPYRRLVGSDRQACLEEASLMALAVDFALVVLGSEVGGHGEFRLALQRLCRVRGGRDPVAHLREGGGEGGMMRVVRPC